MTLGCRIASVAVVAVIMSALAGVGFVSALGIPETTPTPPILPNSPIIITAYQISGSSLEFVQIYNNSNELISIDGAVLGYTYSNEAGVHDAVALSGLMRPRTHAIISVEGTLQDVAVANFSSTVATMSVTINSIQLSFPGTVAATIPASLKTNGTIQQRGKTSTGYSTVTFGSFDGILYADQLYETPVPPQLRIVEISARAMSCSPFEDDPKCGDYVKFKVLPGFDVGLISDYRLRSDTGSESVTNTFSLSSVSIHGDFLLLRLRDDGELMSLTNSGGHVWLEDSFGVLRYEDSLTVYADAGSENYIDQSWALDESDGLWKWGIPNPTGPNIFPQTLSEVEEKPVATVCSTGKYLNPETNRCRSIEEAVSALATCEEGKERNPLTNRCRTVATLAAATLTPCDVGEERNLATNRCRKVLAASTLLAPCEAGYERNPETNRCRKTLSAATAFATPAAIDASTNDSQYLKNALIITAGIGAFGYGLYEWRSEVLRMLRRLAGSSAGK